MRPSVLELLPDPDFFLDMEPEEGASYLIAYFNMRRENPSPKQYLNRTRFANALFSPGLEIPNHYIGLTQQKREAAHPAVYRLDVENARVFLTLR